MDFLDKLSLSQLQKIVDCLRVNFDQMPKDLRNIWISYIDEEEIFRLIKDPDLRNIAVRAAEQKEIFMDEDIIKFANNPHLRHIALREIKQKEVINIDSISDAETYLSLVDESKKGEFNVIYHQTIDDEFPKEFLLKLLTHPKLKTTITMSYDASQNYFYRRLFDEEEKIYNIRDMTIEYEGPTETYGIIDYILEAKMPYLEEVSFINAGEDGFPTALQQLLEIKRPLKLYIIQDSIVTNANIIELYEKGLLKGVQSISFYDCEGITIDLPDILKNINIEVEFSEDAD